MRYTTLLLASALAASHNMWICHGKPLPTPTPVSDDDDPPYSEGFPAAAEAEPVSTRFAEKETTLPGLYPTNGDGFPSRTDTDDFPSGTFGDVPTEATPTGTGAGGDFGGEENWGGEHAGGEGGHSFGGHSGEEEHSGGEEHSSEGHSGTEEEHSSEGHSSEEHSSEEHPDGDGHSSEEHFDDKEHTSEEHTSEEHSGGEEHSFADEEHHPVETSASDVPEEHGAPPNHEAHSSDAESSSDESDSNDEAHSHQDVPSEHDAPSNDEDWSQHEAPVAEPSPKPDQDRPCGKLDPWTIRSLSRQCDDADLVCGWSFIIDTKCPSFAPTPCTFSIKSLGPGVPASRSPKHEKGQNELCGPYEVHSAWSGQFGPGQGFTTLSVIDNGNKLVAYPAYRDDLFGKGKETVPDVEVAVYAMG